MNSWSSVLFPISKENIFHLKIHTIDSIISVWHYKICGSVDQSVTHCSVFAGTDLLVGYSHVVDNKKYNTILISIKINEVCR